MGQGSGLLGLTGVLRARTAHRAPAVLAAKHGVVAGTCPAEFAPRFHEDFDGDSSHT